ncbi:hypothetical protein [Streptomyces sp. NPDC091416]
MFQTRYGRPRAYAGGGRALPVFDLALTRTRPAAASPGLRRR